MSAGAVIGKLLFMMVVHDNPEYKDVRYIDHKDYVVLYVIKEGYKDDGQSK